MLSLSQRRSCRNRRNLPQRQHKQQHPPLPLPLLQPQPRSRPHPKCS
jgi:hypothetical protein